MILILMNWIFKTITFPACNVLVRGYAYVEEEGEETKSVFAKYQVKFAYVISLDDRLGLTQPSST